MSNDQNARLPGPCIEPEVLAAYADRSLPEDRRASVSTHLAACRDCYEWLTEVLRTNDAFAANPAEAVHVVAAPVVLRPSSGRSRVWMIGGTLAAAAAAILAIRLITIPIGSDERITRLVDAVGTDRTVEPRLTGGFAHGALRSQTRGSGGGDNLSLTAAAGELQRAVRTTPTAANLHAYGIAQLLLGNYDDAVANLEAALAEDPDNAMYLSDLAAAYVERGARGGQPGDLPLAVEHAERALRQAPALPEALFTRALAFEYLGLRKRAADGWTEYLRVDSDSGWAREAAGRAKKLQEFPPQSQWRDLPQILERGSLTPAALRAMCIDVPDAIPEALIGALLRSWARDGSAADQARLLGVQLATEYGAATGDQSLRRAFAALPSSLVPPSPRGAGLRALSDGYRLLNDDRYLDAEPHLREATTSLRESDLLLWQWARFGLARIRYFRGDLAGSAADFSSVIASAESGGAPSLVARALWLRGIVTFSQGSWSAARRDYERAIAAFMAVGDAQGAATVHVNLSILFRFLGDREQVWGHRLAALRRMPAHRPSLLHGFLVTTAITAALEGQDHTALVFFDEAIRNSDATPVYTKAETLLQRAKVHARLERLADAQRDIRLAREAWTTIVDAAVRDRVLVSLLTAESQVYHQVDPPAAVRAAREAIAQVTARGDDLRSAELHLYLGRALALMHDRPAAGRALADGIADFARARQSLSVFEATRLSSFEPVWDLFNDAFNLTIETEGFDRTIALRHYEASRAQTLLELRSGSRVDFDDARQHLGPNTALILLQQQADALVAWVIRRDDDQLIRVALSESAARRLNASYFHRLTLGADTSDSAADIYRSVVAPVLGGLPDGSAIVLVPDRPFTNLPWAAMRDPVTRQSVLERWTVSVAPSVALAVPRQRAGDTLRHDSALVVSAPTADEGLPFLAGARDEARDIARIYPHTELLEGNAAAVREVMTRLPDYPVVHFSAHALNNVAYPLLSRLVLPGSEGDEQGLEVRDLVRVPNLLRGSVVVLAACRSVGPAAPRGEGAVGLAWGFLAAGATSVVATLWDVDDRAVSGLFVELHRRLAAGDTPAVAVRTAQLAALAQGQPERVWASVQVIGRP